MRRRAMEELASSAVETTTVQVAAVVVVAVAATTAEMTDATFICRSSPRLCPTLLMGDMVRVAAVATGIRTVMVVKRPNRQKPTRISSRAQQPSRSLKSSYKLRCRPVSTGSSTETSPEKMSQKRRSNSQSSRSLKTCYKVVNSPTKKTLKKRRSALMTLLLRSSRSSLT